MLRLLFLGAVATSFASVSVKDCSSGTSVFKVDALSFAPDAPVGGMNGTLHSIYEVPAEYNAGTVRYSCSINGLPVYDESFDICTQTTCPIVIGTHDDYSTSQVPDVSGKVVCKIIWTDLSSNTLLCIQTNMVLATKKKTLRGKPVHIHFHTHSAAPKDEMCPLIEDYDPIFMPQEAVIEEEIRTPSPSEKAKKALIVLRSEMKYIDK
jgi:hypothetical protein